jgi:hypothetical protein
MSNAIQTLSDLFKANREECYKLCSDAALYHAAKACELGNAESPFLVGITVADARSDARRNLRARKH